MGEKFVEICGSVGIELEHNSLSVSGGFPPRGIKIPPGWGITRDGSCTRNGATIGGVGVATDDMLQRLLPRHQVGGEFVSPILPADPKKIYDDVESILGLMERYGEAVSTLTSTHFHIYMGKYPPAHVLKNLLHIAIRLEAPLFRLSVAELLEHRGIAHNDFMYCRPLTGPGPQYILDEDDRWRQCFDLHRILDHATTVKDILRAWGRADYQPSKWIPPRYYWLNPVPLVRQGTMEFRLFNQTLDAKNVVAWAMLCVAIVKTAYGGSEFSELDWPLFPLGEQHPIGDSGTYRFKDIWNLVNPTFIGADEYDQLHKMWLKADWQPGVEEQVNHLAKDGRHRTPIQAVAKKLVPETVSQEYVDSIWNQGYYDAIGDRR
jgi:hypothetical protein